MKIWNSYGSEHSMNLVIIGKFKTVKEAEEFEVLSNDLRDFLVHEEDFEHTLDRFSSSVSEFLRKQDLYCLSPEQLEHFIYDYKINRDSSEIHISSDDDINGFISLLIKKGARVEVFSAHDFPIKDNEAE